MERLTPQVNIPRIVFIVPYRDREAHKNMFINHMPFILDVYKRSDYEVVFVEPKDDKPFNRGAMKNIGFLYVKNKYPTNYRNITLVFNDVDTLPGLKNMWDYDTQLGNVKHFYGFAFALGGIVSIKAGDFERVNGFPNFWGWGLEDNCLQQRCVKHTLNIDRSKFYKYGDQNILQFFNGIQRRIDSDAVMKAQGENGSNGIRTISGLQYNERIIENNYISVDVTSWNIPEKYEKVLFEDKVVNGKLVNNRFNMGNIMRMR